MRRHCEVDALCAFADVFGKEWDDEEEDEAARHRESTDRGTKRHDEALLPHRRSRIQLVSFPCIVGVGCCLVLLSRVCGQVFAAIISPCLADSTVYNKNLLRCNIIVPLGTRRQLLLPHNTSRVGLVWRRLHVGSGEAQKETAAYYLAIHLTSQIGSMSWTGLLRKVSLNVSVGITRDSYNTYREGLVRSS